MHPVTERILSGACLMALSATAPTLHAAEPPLNVLLITADDLGWEAMDFLHGKVPGVTPNLSKLAAESLNFLHGFSNVAISAPSRSVMATGCYSHHSGLYGFNKMPQQITTRNSSPAVRRKTNPSTSWSTPTILIAHSTIPMGAA